MRIHSLRLENTKSYADADITFTPGTNAIVGQNGAGKSTILEAIGFALFDHLPYNQNDFVREGEKSATVTVTFQSSADERDYEVVRRCGSSSAYYIYDPETAARVCEGKADVMDFLKRHMGVDPGADLGKLFSDAVGVPQGTLTAAFLQTPGPRKITFDPLLQVAEYKDAADRLREPARVLKERLTDVDVTLGELRGRLARLPALQEQAADLTRRLAQAETDLADATAQLAQAQTQLGSLDSLRQRVERLRAEGDRAGQRAADLAERLAASARRRERAAAAQAIVQAQQNGHDAYLSAQVTKTQLDARQHQRQQLMQQRSRLENVLSQLRARLDGLDGSLAEIAQAEARRDELMPQVAEQARLESELAQAKETVRSLAEDARTLTTRRAQQSQILARRDALQAELDRGDALRAQRDQLAEAITAAEQTVSEQQAAGIRLQAEGQTVRQQQQALADASGAACPVCEQPLTPTHRTAMQTRNAARLAELAQAEQAARTALSGAQAELKRLREQRKAADASLQQLPRPQEVARLTTEADDLAQEVEHLSARAAQLDAAQREQTALGKQISDLGNPRQEQAIAANMAQKRAGVEDERNRCRHDIARQEENLAQLDEELAGFAGLDEELADVIRAVQSHLPAYQAVLANRQTADTLAQEQTEVDRLTQAHAQADAAQADARRALAEAQAEFDADAFAAAQAQVQSVAQRQAGLAAEMRLGRESLAAAQAELAELAKHQEAEAVARQTQHRLERQRSLLESLRMVLRQAGPHVTAALVQQISFNAAQLFGEIMQDFTRRLAWGEDYGISLEVNGNVRAFAQLSGGEQMAAALSVRLALLKEMSSIDIAFFDEPTTNLDEARRESLAQQILGVKGLGQLFVISHDDTFEQATETLIRVSKIDGKSVVENG